MQMWDDITKIYLIWKKVKLKFYFIFFIKLWLILFRHVRSLLKWVILYSLRFLYHKLLKAFCMWMWPFAFPTGIMIKFLGIVLTIRNYNFHCFFIHFDRSSYFGLLAYICISSLLLQIYVHITNVHIGCFSLLSNSAFKGIHWWVKTYLNAYECPDSKDPVELQIITISTK